MDLKRRPPRPPPWLRQRGLNSNMKDRLSTHRLSSCTDGERIDHLPFVTVIQPHERLSPIHLALRHPTTGGRSPVSQSDSQTTTTNSSSRSPSIRKPRQRRSTHKLILAVALPTEPCAHLPLIGALHGALDNKPPRRWIKDGVPPITINVGPTSQPARFSTAGISITPSTTTHHSRTLPLGPPKHSPTGKDKRTLDEKNPALNVPVLGRVELVVARHEAQQPQGLDGGVEIDGVPVALRQHYAGCGGDSLADVERPHL